MDNISLKFFLFFKSFLTPEQIEITEAVKTDGFSNGLEKNSMLGLDVFYGAEEVSLFFYDGVYDKSENPLMLPDGQIVYNLTMGFAHIKKAFNQKGFESEINLIIQKEGVDFTTGTLVILNTDEETFFECKLIQVNERAEITRRAETKVDVFSNKDLKGNTIEPLGTTNLLLKAKPTEYISEWSSKEGAIIYAAGSTSSPAFFNVIKATTGRSGIPNTLSWLEDYTSDNSGDYENYNPPPDYFRIIQARFLLTNITAELDLSMTNEWIDEGLPANFQIIGRFIKFSNENGNRFIDVFNNINSPNNVLFYRSEALGPTAPYGYVYNFDGTITVDLPDMLPGEILAFVFFHGASNSFQVSKNTFNRGLLKVRATENGFDSVIKVARYGGLFRQNIKSINGLSTIMPRFDIGGEFYNLFATNGYLARQFVDKAFRVMWKDLTQDGLPAFNGGYQITKNGVFIGRYPDFYPNREIGVLQQLPDQSFNISFSDKAQINTVDLQFKTYEKDNDKENTIDGIHNVAQYSIPNQLVNGQRKIEIGHIYDPFALSSMQKQATNTKPNTTLDNDEKVFVIDAVEIAPGTKKTIQQVLLQRPSEADPNRLEILNGNLSESGYFNWLLLGGFNIGNTITITTGVNSGVYTVLSVTPNVLILQGSATVTQVEALVSIEYTLTDVLYTNRTNEGFTLVENIMSPDKFGNLNYSPARILFDFYGQEISTACVYHPNELITVTDPPINENATIQYQGDRIFKQDEAIPINELPDAILSPLYIKTKTVAPFDVIVDILSKLDTIYPDGTVGGYIRIVGNSGKVFRLHPSKLDQEWLNEQLIGEGSPRQENEYVTITTIVDGVISIQEIGYEATITGGDWFDVNGDDVVIFDGNAIPLINPTSFDKVSVNGVVYDSANNLAIALSLL